MNAQEVLRNLSTWASPTGINSAEWDTILRALRLLTAAEANDGTGCKLVEDLRTEADLCRNETATDIADLLDDAASSIIAISAQFNAIKDERNGLAARVGELERELQAHRGHLVEAIYGRPCPTHRQWEQMQEVAAKAMAARGSKP